MIVQIIKKIGWFILMGIFAFCLINLEWVIYGMRQARGQFNLVNNSIPAREFLDQNDIPFDYTEKLALLDTVKDFAHEALNLEKSSIYSSIYDQKGEPVLFVVTACKRFQMEPFEWKIPLAGSFPYKGFFEKEWALKERDLMERLGYDVFVRITDGWSTLGFFQNPLLTNNLEESKGELCELVIHEIAHETIFVKSDVEFNENLATFIGLAGTRLFLESYFGLDSPELHQYLELEKQTEQYVGHMVRGADKLDSLYASFEGDTSERENKKISMIMRIIDSMDTLHLDNKDEIDSIFRAFPPNNAYFMSFLRYRSQQEYFYDTLNSVFQGDLPSYISDLKERY